MKVFISWSGPRSMQLAEALNDWIHNVIQSVECFYSSEDIRAGQRWNAEINAWLANTDFGVLCVTPENISASWLNFEAGALAKKLSNENRVVPVTLGFSPASLEDPLRQFNGVEANKAGILKMLRSIADVAKPSFDVERTFELWWPELETKIAAIPESSEKVAVPEPPDQTELLTEVLGVVRGIAREQNREQMRGLNALLLGDAPESTVNSARWVALQRRVIENIDPAGIHGWSASRDAQDRAEAAAEHQMEREAEDQDRAEAMAEREAEDHARFEAMAEREAEDRARAAERDDEVGP